MTKIEQKHIFKNSFIRKDYSKNFRYLAAVLACKMAAIIAQLTLGNRERKVRALNNIGCTKCNYTLQPFDQNGFDPKVHNRRGRGTGRCTRRWGMRSISCRKNTKLSW